MNRGHWIERDCFCCSWSSGLWIYKARASDNLTILPSGAQCLRISSDRLWKESLLSSLTCCYRQVVAYMYVPAECSECSFLLHCRLQLKWPFTNIIMQAPIHLAPLSIERWRYPLWEQSMMTQQRYTSRVKFSSSTYITSITVLQNLPLLWRDWYQRLWHTALSQVRLPSTWTVHAIPKLMCVQPYFCYDLECPSMGYTRGRYIHVHVCSSRGCHASPYFTATELYTTLLIDLSPTSFPSDATPAWYSMAKMGPFDWLHVHLAQLKLTLQQLMYFVPSCRDSVQISNVLWSNRVT